MLPVLQRYTLAEQRYATRAGTLHAHGATLHDTRRNATCPRSNATRHAQERYVPAEQRYATRAATLHAHGATLRCRAATLRCRAATRHDTSSNAMPTCSNATRQV